LRLLAPLRVRSVGEAVLAVGARLSALAVVVRAAGLDSALADVRAVKI